MPRGDSLIRFWDDYRNGKAELGENHGKRGKDKPTTFRKISSTDKTFSTRYYERTGRTFDKEIATQRALIDIMIDEASQIEDDDERMKALNNAYDRLATWTATFAPYMEQKLDTLRSTETMEDKLSLDDLLNEAPQIEDKSDED